MKLIRCIALAATIAVPVAAQTPICSQTSPYNNCSSCTEGGSVPSGCSYSFSAVSCQESGTCKNCCWDLELTFTSYGIYTVDRSNTYIQFGGGVQYGPQGTDLFVKQQKTAVCNDEDVTTICSKGHVRWDVFPFGMVERTRCRELTCPVCSAGLPG